MKHYSKPADTMHLTESTTGKATPMKTSNCTELISVLVIGLLYSAGFAIVLIAPAL